MQTRFALTLAGTVGRSAARESRAVVRGLPTRISRRVPGGAPRTDFDPLDPDVLADPYPWYARLHESAPLVYNAERQVWIISRYDEVRAAARADEALSSAEGITPTRGAVPMLIVTDRPAHTRLRRLVATRFTRQAVEGWTPQIEAITREAFDAMPVDAPADAVGGLTVPVPVEVIATLLGVPRADRARFRRLSEHIVQGFSIGKGSEWVRQSRAVLGAVMALHAYFQTADRASDGVLAHLEEGQLSADERFWFALMLLVAGNETTTSLLGGMLLAFAEHPETYARLREDPSLTGAVIEESLRFTSSLQGLYRTAVQDYAVGDATIPAGGRALLLFGAANRDPRRFTDPDRFDIDRDAREHLAFGMGIHFCLGAHLARLESEVFLRELTARARAIEVSGAPEWNGNPSLRGLARLPLRLRPASSRRSARSPR